MIVWLAVRYGGRTCLLFFSGRQNHTVYIDSELPSYGSELCGEECIFQRDEASIDTASGVKNWLTTNNVQVLPWPAKSPVLNIAENTRAMLFHQLYASGKQLKSLFELRKALKSLYIFCQTEIQSLYDLLPNRIFEVVKANKESIPY